jgi:hypothetical protein
LVQSKNAPIVLTEQRIAVKSSGIPNLKPIAGEYEAFNLKNDETSL